MGGVEMPPTRRRVAPSPREWGTLQLNSTQARGFRLREGRGFAFFARRRVTRAAGLVVRLFAMQRDVEPLTLVEFDDTQADGRGDDLEDDPRHYGRECTGSRDCDELDA